MLAPYCATDDGQVSLYHADWHDGLPSFPDDTADLVVTDPPYPGLKGNVSIKLGSVGRVRHPTQTVGDPWEAQLDWCAAATRIARLGVMVFCSYHSVADVRAAFASLDPLALLTWHKRNAPLPVGNVPRHTTEFVWCFKKRAGLRWRLVGDTLIDLPNLAAGAFASERLVDRDGVALHPTQKPVGVMMRLLAVAGPGALVLDPFAGTGTTLVAARSLGLRAVGIEREERYCALAAERLRQHVLPLDSTPTTRSAAQGDLDWGER